MFLTDATLADRSWQSFERLVCRLLLHLGYEDVRLVGQSGDKGADVLASFVGRRWLFQVKHWQRRVGPDVVDQTMQACRHYRAEVPVIVSLGGFDEAARTQQQTLMAMQMPLQLWDRTSLVTKAASLEQTTAVVPPARQYQEDATRALLQRYLEGPGRRALLVMATGLGKTYTAYEMLRRLNGQQPIRVLSLAHTNELVYQLEKAIWPFLGPDHATLVWNGYEAASPLDLSRTPFVFACINTVAEHVHRGGQLPAFDVVLVDECHHVGGQMYRSVLENLSAGGPDGPFLLGLTATPWRADEFDPSDYFGEPVVCVDMVTGLRRGFLSNVDYRMYTDNINWNALSRLHGASLSPRQVNRTLFITQWDDAVVYQLQGAWQEQSNPRAIVFCGTIDHALTMRDRINALGFCSAAAIYSQGRGTQAMSSTDRARLLCDFHDGVVQVMCAVDIFNEGIDVPDVNIIVFQRVTHSRRIFVQQLGRGLRISPGKTKVIVLDFVSDIRRFAAGLELKRSLSGQDGVESRRPRRVSLPHKVTFHRASAEDHEAESFLREWLEDVAAVEAADEDASVLKFPPPVRPGV